jgi:hypothetical protein
LHTVNWAYNLAQRPAPRAPLSPSEKRDSLLRAVRGPVVLDSLSKAKFDSSAIAVVRGLLNAANNPAPPFGGGRGGGGGGGGRGGQGACERPLTQWEPFCARPAEAAPGGGRGAAPAAAGGEADFAAIAAQFGGRGGGAAANPNVAKIYQLIGIPAPGAGGGRGGGGGFGGGGARNASTGDYQVILQVNGQTIKQKLHVENVGAGDTSSPFGPASGDDDDRGDGVKAKAKARVK